MDLVCQVCEWTWSVRCVNGPGLSGVGMELVCQVCEWTWSVRCVNGPGLSGV